MDELVAEDYLDHNPPPFLGLAGGARGIGSAGNHETATTEVTSDEWQATSGKFLRHGVGNGVASNI
jgi:hypothetical protein